MNKFDDKAFIRSLNAVAKTKDGKVLLAMLHHDCGWDKTFLASDNPQTTHYFATRRGVYGGLRQYVDPKHLKEIEHDYKFVKTEKANDGRTSNTSGITNKRTK